MAFAYRELTVSGNASGIEGTGKLIQEIKDTLVNNMGWILTDERSTQPGTSHIVTLQSNGETNNKNTFYLILTSGTGASATVGQDDINFRVGTAWSTGTHSIPSSGTGTPVTSGTATLKTDSNGLFTAWLSGDKDAVTFITKVGALYDGVHTGRINQFTSPTLDQWPIYVIGNNSSFDVDILAGTAGNAYTLLSSTVATGNNEADWDSMFTSPLGSDQHPNNLFGSSEAYVALPLVAGVSDNTPLLKSVRGFSMNLWATVASGNQAHITIKPEDELATSDGKVYKVFFDNKSSTSAAVIRKS